MQVPAERITQLLFGMAPAVCVACLTRVTRLPEATVHEVTTDLANTEVIIKGTGPCSVCGSRRAVLRAVRYLPKPPRR